jgi:hypothetical protein
MTAAAAPASLRQGVLHLFVLSAFAVAQPLFDLLGRYATFFVAHGAQPRQIVFFVLVLCVGPASGLAALELAVAAVSARARRAVHAVLVAVLLAVVVLPPLNRAAALAPVPAFAIAGLAGALGALAYVRSSAVRMFVTVLAPAGLIFPLLFLFATPVAELIRSQRPVEAAASAVTHPAPTVMVVFDELSLLALMDRNQQIDAARYPNFARLAGMATWYRNATSVADNTVVAVPAILTGTLPSHSTLPTLREHPHNLFTLLGGAYDLRVIEPVTDLCPRELCPRSGPDPAAAGATAALLSDAGLVFLHMLAPPGLRAGLPDIQRQWTFQFDRWNYHRIVGATSLDRPALFDSFVDAIQPGPRPTLDFLHILLPHYPYMYFPSGTSYLPPSPLFGRPPFNFFAPGDQLDGAAWSEDDHEGARLEQQRYLNQLVLVDRLVGRLLDHLQSTGLLDQTLLVITADHGVCFRPGQSSRYVNDGNHTDIMAVPLFIKAPHQRAGQIDDRNVETIDILPTIADLLGIALPWPVDGRSVVASPQPERAEKVIVSPTSRSNQLDLKRFVYPGTRPSELQGLDNMLAVFGSDRLDDSVPSPRLRALLNQPVAALPKAPPSALHVTLEQPERFAQVNTAGGRLPAFVQGHVQPAPPPHTALAIAVNGVVRAVTEVLPDQSETPAFGALVPEPAWQDGANTVEVLAVVPLGDSLGVAPLSGTTP